MNRLAKWMMRLYPARWRRRYGDELDALLAQSGADARVVADLMKGGVRMQFSTWSFAKLAVVLGIAGLLLGAAGSFLIAPIYVSNATLQMTSLSPEPVSARLDTEVRRIEPSILSRTSLAEMINSPHLDLYVPKRKVTAMEDVIENMKDHIRFDFIGPAGAQKNSASLRISFEYPDPAKAHAVTAILVQKFVDESFQQRIHEDGEHDLSVVDYANLPVLPVFPKEQIVLLVGCLLAASIPFAWRRMRRKSMATWSFPVQVVVFGVAGLLAANIGFVLGQNIFPYTYRSTATMFVRNGTPQQLQTIATDATSRTTLGAIINNPRLDLYKGQRKTDPMEDVILNMQRHLTITPSGQFFTIAFEYPDRYKAQMTVNAVMIALEKSFFRSHGNLPDAPVQSAPEAIKLIDEASTPVDPISPNRFLIAMQGGLAGLIVGAIIATIRRRWNPQEELPVDAVNG